MDRTTEIVQAAAQVLLDAALRLIQNDPHQWSKRGCATCQAVSTIVGKPFGCCLYAAIALYGTSAEKSDVARPKEGE